MTFLGLVQMALASVQIVGDAECPRASDVEAELRRLSGPSRTAPRLIVQAAQGAAQLTVEMLNIEGQPIARRNLPQLESCSEMATAVAVVSLAWEAELGSGSPPAPSLRRNVAPASSLEVAVAFRASVAGTPAIGAHAHLALVRPDAGLGWHLSLGGAGTRSVALGSGAMRWQRFHLGVGPLWRWSLRAVVLDAHGEALGGLLAVGGNGFAQEQSESGVDLGLGMGLRARLGRSAWSPWLGLSVSQWLLPQVARVEGLDEQARIPRLELGLSAGVSWSQL